MSDSFNRLCQMYIFNDKGSMFRGCDDYVTIVLHFTGSEAQTGAGVSDYPPVETDVVSLSLDVRG